MTVDASDSCIKYAFMKVDDYVGLRKSLEDFGIRNFQSYNPIMTKLFDIDVYSQPRIRKHGKNNAKISNSDRLTKQNRAVTWRLPIHVESINWKTDPITNDPLVIEEKNANPLDEYFQFHTWNIQVHDYINSVSRPENVFIKVNPILEPVRYMMGRYDITTSVCLPHMPDSRLDATINRIFSSNCEAYIDSFFSHLGSLLVETGKCPHFARCYGSGNGILDKYYYNMTDEYYSLINTSWFHAHRGHIFNILTTSHDARILELQGVNQNASHINKRPINFTILEDQITSSQTPLAEIRRNTRPDTPKSTTSTREHDDNNDDLINKQIAAIENLCDEIIDFDDEISDSIPNIAIAGSLAIPYETTLPEEFADHDESSDTDNDDDDDDMKSDSSSSSRDDPDKIGNQKFAIFNRFPVQLTFIEKLDGTLEDLITTSHHVSQKQLDQIWSAYLFQIIFALAVAQKEYNFTHNDLHINNVMYSNTDIKELIYHIITPTGEKRTYTIPTYGKIMKIIDFGRAIYTYHGKKFVSDAFEADGDAGGQYNFPPFYDPEYRRVNPNPSFDLSRLSSTLIENLFPIAPPFIKDSAISATNGPTISPVFNILLEWITDKYGKNILRKPNGEERFPNFDIYKIIARRVNSAIPAKQITKPLFDIFINNTATGINGITAFSLKL